jgi:hypothetical protein
MALFALCFNPMIICLEENLKGLRFNRGQRKMTVVASADDITFLVIAPEEIEVLKEIIVIRAMGTLLNVGKSEALAVGTLDTTRSVLRIPYGKVIKILGFQMTNKTTLTKGHLVEGEGQG